ncbi:MAG: flagellar basal body rod protein FlgC [Thalassolituus sp.]|jgi:flagellar basal-body rod protein FlgC|uniref:Flagellar basal-body rod protein FlgC n=2 Tax=root TaxID=1 RepID=M5DUB9_9GAMM|nr:flagellar basal body rod protein FlgC [Thalassolituus oleivorans]PCI50724.1 MAG: flagellar basal body rod protein FlgC [Oceanospirillales bacterium]AHK15269.1 flagellar basal body rod protein FlgC [Thalassolituus oleivorans R6-15]APR66418.1 flagellar basal body rod protein FlgC [Thalassolituus oleivorans]MBQ0727021.1 flagellar basal body rod protein FlgC [Thalassolituus oleivorans]MBQ0782166.1 flagellar basal body rod protein FlgC [Thalassolituus oleivorans]|tara:strand:+ start:372 stop:821 length:450 start_codon:yes stop_codon:yes gene_type:complete
MSLTSVLDIAGTGMNAQSIRLNTTASNIANAESASSSVDETYRARKPWFAVLEKEQSNINSQDEAFMQSAEGTGAGVQVMGIVEKDSPLQMRFQPNHPMANEDGYVYYPNVNVVEEMTDMMSSSRSYQMNIEVLKTAKQMLQRTLTLGQ